MNILIVEDNKNKCAKVVQCIESTKINPHIDIAWNGNDARSHLASTKYDLLILDLAIPLYEGSAPDDNGGRNILREINDRGLLKMPSYIVGLTGYDDLWEEQKDKFENELVLLLKYEVNNNNWCNQLTKQIINIDSLKNDNTKTYDIDLCIVTALNDPELDAILKLDWNWNLINSDNDPSEYYLGSLLIDDTKISVVAACATRAGMVSSTILATKMINNFKPLLLGMTGICAGLEDATDFGDIIAADPVWNYQSGKKYDGTDGFKPEPHQLNMSNLLRRRFQLMERDSKLLEEIRERWTKSNYSNTPKLITGPIATGSQVVADTEVINNIKEHQRKLVGVEMEIYGLYASAEEATYPQPQCFALKSVSDYADSSKNDDHQEYAAYTSAMILKSFVEKHLISIKKMICGN